MAASTVPAVRAALVDRITAAVDVPVFYGHPGRNIPRQFVAVAQTEDGLAREQVRMPLRSTSMVETYSIRLVVWFFSGDHHAGREVYDAAWAVADAIEADLRAEPTLGGLVTWALVQRVADDDLFLDEGRAAQLLLSVSVNANRA